MQSKAILFSGIALQAQRFANLVHEAMSLWCIHLLVSVGFFCSDYICPCQKWRRQATVHARKPREIYLPMKMRVSQDKTLDFTA